MRSIVVRCTEWGVPALFCLLCLAGLPRHAAAQNDPIPVQINVDAANPTGELREIWRFFGADEPNYAYGPSGSELIGHLGELRPKQVFFRAHNLLTTGNGEWALKWGSTNAYTEDADGNPVYDWTIVDKIFDTYIEQGVRPYVEIGFMPEALSSRPQPYRHQWDQTKPYNSIYTGWAHPPNDYEKWGELVHQWVLHCIERYGKKEVEQWYWQTWNEPNISYWQGSLSEFLRLNDYAIDGVLRALPTAKVGGADTAGSGGDFSRAFFDHCLRGNNYAVEGQVGTQLDFVSFHAKGSPQYVDNHVRMGIANQLRTIDKGFRIIAAYPELRDTPIVIGESDPEGCAACAGPHLGYRNGTMYSSYTAASFARKLDLADRWQVNLEGALTWAFTFEDQPYFAGFRALSTNGIDKPVLNVFRMYSHMSGDRLPAESSNAVSLDQMMRHGVRRDADIAALASRDGNKVAVMVWYYHDDDLPGPDAEVELDIENIDGLPDTATLTHYRIDQDHSNAYTAWQAMGSPQEMTDEQYAKVDAAGKLHQLHEPRTIERDGNQYEIEFTLPRQGVSLIVIEWE